MVPIPAALASPGNLLEMQVLGTSLGVQGLRLHLPTQGVSSTLVREQILYVTAPKNKHKMKSDIVTHSTLTFKMVHITHTDKGTQILGLCPTEWETLSVRINSVYSNKRLGTPMFKLESHCHKELRYIMLRYAS